MPEVPEEEEEEPTTETITDGYFEEEYYVSAENVGEFLAELAEQFKTEDEITITGDDWELPFAFGEPVKLEIEVELSGRIEDETPDIA